jgi:hypothetical protein
LNQAVTLKTGRAATLRSIYDSYPKFFQRSFFPSVDVMEARALCTFAGKLKVALHLKECGKDLFQQSNFTDALHQYEKSLAIFKYLENTNPNWQKEVCLLSISSWSSPLSI